MTIWEKAILNMQKGTQKLSTTAAILSERVRAEIEIARLRIKLDEVRAIINEQYQIIGRTIVELKSRAEMPKTTDQLMKDESIVAALSEIDIRDRDRTDLEAEIEEQMGVFKPAKKEEDESL